jgi:hypothetical protein
MKASKPDNVIPFKKVQGMKNQKPRQIPTKIFGVSEATLFDKRADKRMVGFCADGIRMSLDQKEELPLVAYQICTQRGELATLQKMLKQGDAHESTRFKLLIAYKAALADSDAFIRSLTDAVDLCKPPTGRSDPSLVGWMFWGSMGPYDLAEVIREHGLKPPTLAGVRRYFVWLYPGCKNNWPGGDASRDKVHRTTIARMGLPLAKDKVGRPSKVKTSR